MERLAVVGGDGRFDVEGWPGSRVRVFKAERYGGNGPLRSFERSIRSGGVDRVLVLARWNSHSTTRRVTRLCRQLGIPCQVVP